MAERGEAAIRMDASMWALVAKLEHLKTTRLSMEAANESRQDKGLAQAYGEEAFVELAEAMLRVCLDLTRKGEINGRERYD
jgi:hypothetical protein